MKSFILYLKSKRGILLFSILSVVVFTGSFILYRLPAEAVLYPAGIVLVMGLLFLAAGYRRDRARCRELELLLTRPAEMLSEMPAGTTPAEEAWSHLAASIREELIEIKTSARGDYQDMVDYFTVWAHQVKTPIAAMKLTLQGEDSELSRQLRSDLFRTQQYIDMVLAFLRLGSDSSDHVFRSLSLDEIIRPSVRKFAPEFIHRRLALKYSPIEKTVVTDEKWFAFVLQQLLSNALKYTRVGNISIHMTDARTLCIADTGIGIAPDELPRVCEKGYTGMNGRLDRNASGLGLYLCKRVCERLNITLSITSRVGQGTQVYLTLPE